MMGEFENPFISVCIANFNGMGVIDDCLRSVQKQIGNLSIEIIVHDDASTDGSAEYIRLHYPDVVLLESAENVGFCVSNNRMVDRARSKYILLLNNDAALFPDALTTLKMEAERIGRPAMLGLPQYDADTGELADIGSLLDPFLNSVPNLDSERGDVGMVAGACLWMPKTLWLELGGFPEWFGSIGEDLYLCCRARLAGYQVRALGNSGFRHHIGHSFGGGKVKRGQLSSTLMRRAMSERNKTFVMIVSYPDPALQIMLPLHLALLMAEGLAISLAKRSLVPWRSIYAPLLPDLWHNKKRILDLRRQIQSTRHISSGQWFSAFLIWPYKLRMLLKYGLPELR
ncbi:MAG: glycosyltransferase [Nitrosomonadales bacterium]|nr:glycosyltransferase [Nitrosomonadales bacterium]